MLIFDDTTRSLEMKLSAAVATDELPIVASWVDITTTTFLPGTTNGETNGTTAVTVIDPPGSSPMQRQAKFISVYNKDTAPVTIIVQYNDNATILEMFRVTLPINATLQYIDTQGFKVLDSEGNILTSTAVSDHKDNHVSGGSDEFLSADLLEAYIKRIVESDGPTVLTVGSVPDGYSLQRSGTALIGVDGANSGATKVMTAWNFSNDSY